MDLYEKLGVKGLRCQSASIQWNRQLKWLLVKSKPPPTPLPHGIYSYSRHAQK